MSNLDNWHRSLPATYRYLLAAALTLTALLLRFTVIPQPSGFAYLTFYPAILAAFYLGGMGPGIFAAAASGLLAQYFFVKPVGMFPSDYEGYLSLIFFALTCFLIGFFISRLHNRNKQFELILNSDLIGMLRARNRRILWCNDALTRIFGYQREAMIGSSTRMLYPDDASYIHIGETAYPYLARSQTYRTQIQMRHENGDTLWIDLSGSGLSGIQGESIWMLNDITEIKNAELKNFHSAHHDSLTGLPNRLMLADRLQNTIAYTKRRGEHLALCYLDLDGFKAINDSLGHRAGDLLLIEIARRLEHSVREYDTVCRLGGDEFVLLLPYLENAGEYEEVVRRVIESVSHPVLLNGQHQVTVTASAGISLYPDTATDTETLMAQADTAMYQAKKAGRNRMSLFNP
ncbi:MAG: hypothetical protein RL194_826 [Pseudomonadota bacterium]